MNKKNLIVNIAIAITLIGTIVLAIIKFGIPGNPYKFTDFEKITVSGLNGETIPLARIVSREDTTYCFIFNMSDCYSCLLKGFEDLRSLKKDGLPAVALVVSDNVQEVKEWSSNYSFSPFYVIKISMVYQYIKLPKLPLMLEIKKGKIVNIRKITI